MAELKDKVALLMDETGCDRSEAELALELCGYDLENAVAAVPRLFQNIAVLKASVRARSESLYGLWLVILNLKQRSLLRARAVVSYNPAVYASELDQHWFDFEGRLYACRLWVGTMQELSQDMEQELAAYFDSPDAQRFYEEKEGYEEADFAQLRTKLSARLGGQVELRVVQDVLDMGQFQEVRPRTDGNPPERVRRAAHPAGGPGQGPGGMLVLKVALDPDPEGIPAGELGAGDLVSATINDSRDIAQYLGRLFGTRTEEGGSASLLVPIEAIEKDAAGAVTIRVRFSARVCGDVSLPGDLRLKAVPRPSNMPWWKKIFGRP